jgi:hypothetical protein
MQPIPKHGEGRAMISPSRLAFLESASSSSPAETVVGQRQAMFSNYNLVEAIPKVDGFFSLYLKEESEVRQLLYHSTNAFYPGFADFLGVAQVSSPEELFEWSPRSSALRLLTSGQMPMFLTSEATIRELTIPSFNPRRVVCLPEETREQFSGLQPSESVILYADIRAHRIQAEVQSAGPALLVIAQAFYHPWQATVDGGRVPLWRANHAFQALAIPAGRHRVQLLYVDWSFRLGCIVTAVSILSWLSAWFRLKPWSSVPTPR